MDALDAPSPFNVYIHNIHVGPKRTVRRMVDDFFSQPVYRVPAPETWLPATVRLLFHELATWLPEHLRPDCQVLVRIDGHKYNDSCRLLVRARSSQRHTIE